MIRNKFKQLLVEKRGQAMIEFALTATLTMTIIIGGALLSTMNNDAGTLNDAAREGARIASIEYNHSAAGSWSSDAYQQAYETLQAQNMHMNDLQSIQVRAINGPNGQKLCEVNITYKYPVTTEIAKVIFGNYKTIHGFAEFPAEP